MQVALPAYQPPEMLSAVRNELSSTGHAAEAADCWAIGVSTPASADTQLGSLNSPLSYNQRLTSSFAFVQVVLFYMLAGKMPFFVSPFLPL